MSDGSNGSNGSSYDNLIRTLRHELHALERMEHDARIHAAELLAVYIDAEVDARRNKLDAEKLARVAVARRDVLTSVNQASRAALIRDAAWDALIEAERSAEATS